MNEEALKELKEVLEKHNLAIGFSFDEHRHGQGFIVVSDVKEGKDLIKTRSFLIAEDL